MGPLPEELHALVEQNQGLAWNVALRWRRSGLDVEDLAQAGMVGLLKAARGYDPERGQFSTYATWLIRATVRRAAERMLRGRRLDSLDALEVDPPDDADGPPDDLIAGETRAAVWEAVARLPAKDREIVEARYRAGESQLRVGERLGVTRARIYQREARALGVLREALAG